MPLSSEVKRKQPLPGFELGFANPFPTTVTITLNAPLRVTIYNVVVIVPVVLDFMLRQTKTTCELEYDYEGNIQRVNSI